MSGLNRISHPDWVKLCVELNCAPNQNTKFPSVTRVSSKNNLFDIKRFVKKQKFETDFIKKPMRVDFCNFAS